jgi:hypothetical protein
MKAVLVAFALAGCVTTEGIVKQQDTTLPMLAGAAAGDLVVIGVIAKEADNLTTGASIATALAITAVDVFVGCLLGACHSLKL